MCSSDLLLPATGHQQAEELRSQAERLFAGQKLNVRYRIIPMDDPAALRRVLRETPNSMLALGGKQPLQELPSLEEALRESSISLLLARDGEEAG